MPFSNMGGEGFENKLAGLIAADFNQRLEYTWWSERKGFVRKTLEAGRCDAILGLPSGFPGVLTTRPYYRSTYVFVFRKGGRVHVRSLDDPQLRTLRIGVHVVGDDYAPRAQALARRGIVTNIVGYSLFGHYAEQNPAAKIIHAVAAGRLDVAIVWGPLAGYFAAREPTPLEVAPVAPKSAGPSLPLVYDIAIAVRQGDSALKSRLDQFLEEKRSDIQKLLQTYRVPQVGATTAWPGV